MTPTIAQTALQTGANPLHGQEFDNAADARAAAQEFEAFFVAQMFQYMFAGIEQDTLFGGGPGEEMFKSLLLQEYGTEIARSGGLGLADQVMRELIEIQAEPQS